MIEAEKGLDLEAVIIESFRHSLEEVAVRVVCPVHNEKAKEVRIEGRTGDGLRVHVNGCCEVLGSEIKNSMRDLSNS